MKMDKDLLGLWVAIIVGILCVAGVVAIATFGGGCTRSNQTYKTDLIPPLMELGPDQNMGIEIRPVPVIPTSPTFFPGFPPTRITKSKKYTLLWPVPQPEPMPKPTDDKWVPTYKLYSLWS